MKKSSTINESERMREVSLLPYDPEWAQQYQTESLKLKALLGDNCYGVYHIGSTAIPNIFAKPVIDILIAVHDLTKVDALNPKFEALEYTCMGEYGIPERRFYWKGPTTVHTYHVHLFEKYHHEVIRHLTFRDYLQQHSGVAQGYSWIKRCLAEQFPGDIESYVNGKESFIRAIDYRAGVAKQDQLQAQDDVMLKVHDSKWKKLAAAEMNAIIAVTNLPYVKIEHIGSTAIDNIKAKPIIDIFIALESEEAADEWIKPLEDLGYLFWYGNPDKSHYRFFKGMPPCGIARTHHLHIMQDGEDFEKRVAFRDILNTKESLRKEYETLKCKLAEEYAHDREAYTDAKSVFVKQALQTYSKGASDSTD